MAWEGAGETGEAGTGGTGSQGSLPGRDTLAALAPARSETARKARMAKGR